MSGMFSQMVKSATIAVASAMLAAGAKGQPVELKPMDVPTLGFSTMYRVSDYGPTVDEARERAKLREKSRKTYWAEEAERIARSKQNVVRDDDHLYIYLETSEVPRFLVLRSIWTIDPAAQYFYESFDDVARFHIVRVGGSDYPTFLFISATTGSIYEGRGVGKPVYSADRTRFFSAGLGGMGCGGEGFTVYRFEAGKVFLETQMAMGCEQCTHAWSGSDEIKSECTIPNGGRAEYRLTYHDGTWHKARSPEAR